ncbi:MAG: response regulator transcription factor [Nitrospira sp.]|nr:response regulator transcription factor [Nitrospira sp.]
MSTNTIPTLTIALISNHHLAWLGLQKVLESGATRRFIVQQYQRITPDLRLPEDHHPDVFILDMETERDSVGAIRWIRTSAAPTSKILLLSGFEEKDRMHEAFECGVEGVLLKIQPPEVVLAMIDALYPLPCLHTHFVQDLEAITDLKPTFISKTGIERQYATWPKGLTEREREIIKLLRQGLSNKDIAHALSISDSTVRHHLTNIFDKVGVPNRQKLLVHAQTIRSFSE